MSKKKIKKILRRLKRLESQYQKVMLDLEMIQFDIDYIKKELKDEKEN